MVFREASYRIIQQFEMLCTIKDKSNESVCDTGDEEMLTNMVKNAFIDEPSSKESYNFDNDPPILNGQTGVPLLVDKILGIINNPCITNQH